MKKLNFTTSKTIFLFLAILLVFADYFTKFIVKNSFIYGESRSVWGHFIRLTYVENPNSVFGISLGKHFPYIIFSLVILVFIIALFLIENRGIYLFIYSLFIAGATGNMIDRLRFGRVVDFIDVGINKKLTWPIFNIADSCISIGLVFLFLLLIFSKKEKVKNE